MSAQVWEYRVEVEPTFSLDVVESLSKLHNELGSQGWELVAVTVVPGEYANPAVICTYKRPSADR
jgi:hypothetical protein